MTRAVRRTAAFAAVLALTASRASAYNEDPEADVVFPAWLTVNAASTASTFNVASVCYEIYPVGVHRAEVHFRNVSDAPVRFDFWAPGYQRPGDNARVELTPYFRDQRETKVELTLRHGRPGLSVEPLRVYDVRVETDDAGSSRVAPPADVAVSPPPDEDWMPVRGLRDDVVVRRSNLTARFVQDGATTRVVFRNPSSRDLHFAFVAPALGPAGRATPRMHVAAGAEASAVVRADGCGTPLPLLRVTAKDVRVGDDSGAFYAQDRVDDSGWFPLATANGSAARPHDKLFATAAPSPDGRARVRFRSKLHTPVRFRFLVDGYQKPGRDNGVVVVAPGGEAETTVDLDAPADARLALARLRVTEVSHRDGP